MEKTLGQKITQRLAAFAKALENNETISERFTCRRIKLKLEPQTYSPGLVKKTREVLGVSQSLFAQFLGVSVKSISAWERGAKDPSDIACRFMDEIRLSPEFWRKRFRDSMVPKVAADCA